ncbi:hypothetical protein CSB92_1046 [Pseudomonas aeruginosa]|nr:Hypothetical protein SCV20265_5183 [Pseudomonas aeruginosa SCV20265]AWF62551.1 hypothetical protein CSC30_2239 [Pseudomonas aeruginosa]AWF65701.1 hypothetical protein CSC27_4832 [Pseudomonas aeruginosa]AXA06719.1 hypothetical protein CSC44_4061 [Pseudomonas aeruginosa]PRW16320.1 hypothetical protein CSB92_1046 [Pseudomonas aeruginosa]
MDTVGQAICLPIDYYQTGGRMNILDHAHILERIRGTQGKGWASQS